jgi:hypothetical protein
MELDQTASLTQQIQVPALQTAMVHSKSLTPPPLRTIAFLLGTSGVAEIMDSAIEVRQTQTGLLQGIQPLYHQNLEGCL